MPASGVQHALAGEHVARVRDQDRPRFDDLLALLVADLAAPGDRDEELEAGAVEPVAADRVEDRPQLDARQAAPPLATHRLGASDEIASCPVPRRHGFSTYPRAVASMKGPGGTSLVTWRHEFTATAGRR